MLVVAFLVTTATMYSLNKVASAVSEETAEDVGMVLNQNNSGEDSDVAYSTEEISAESAADTSESGDEENATSSEDASANTSDSSETASADSDASGEDTTDNSDNATSDENSSDNSVTEDNAASTETTDDNSSSTEEGSDASSEASSDNQIGENTDSSEIDSTKEGTSPENPTTDNSSTENSLAGQAPAEGENAADKALTSEEDELKTEDKEGKEAEESKAKEGTLASGNEVELTEDVVLTVSYVDEENNSIADEKEISLSESLDFNTEAPVQEGYEFKQASIDGNVITKIVAKLDANEHKYYEVTLANNNEESEAVSDGNASENTEEATVIVIKENKTVVLTYNKIEASRTEYVFENEKVRVVATLEKASAIPDDAEFVVTEVTSETPGYDYDAYMKALNNGEESSLANHNELNTILYDVAFLVDKKDENGNVIEGEKIEYQPEEGSVSIKFEFLEKQLENLDATSGEENGIEVVHMPLDESIRESVDTTADATELEATDITTVPVETEVVSETEEVAISLDNFSLVGFTTNFTGTKVFNNHGRILTYTVNEEKDAYKSSTYFDRQLVFGVAGNFHIVAFDTARLSTHTNGNVLAQTLYADSNFGTKNLDDELSYVQSISKANGNMASADNHVLAVGSTVTLNIIENENFFGVTTRGNGNEPQKITMPLNIIQDKNTIDNPYIDLAAVKEDITRLSEEMSKTSDGGVDDSQNSTSEVTIRYTGEGGAGYKTYKAEDWNNLVANKELKFVFDQGGNVYPDEAIIINIDCAGASEIKMPNKASEIKVGNEILSTSEETAIKAGRVVYNFFNVDKTTGNGKNIKLQEIFGQVIALGANLEVNTGNGNFIAENVTISGETHRRDFVGTTKKKALVRIEATKKVDGQNPTAEQVYDFVVEHGTADDRGNLTFDSEHAITVSNTIEEVSADVSDFIEKKKATYYFRIHELAKEGDESVVYDDSYYLAKVVIGENIDGSTITYAPESVTYYKISADKCNINKLGSPIAGDKPEFKNSIKRPIDITLYKLLNNENPGDVVFDFKIKRIKDDFTGWSNGNGNNLIHNEKDEIKYSIDPVEWSMDPFSKKTYYFKVTEESIKGYMIDKSIIFIKVDYSKSAEEPEVTYWRLNQNESNFSYWVNLLKEATDSKNSNFVKDFLSGICNDQARKVTDRNGLAFRNYIGGQGNLRIHKMVVNDFGSDFVRDSKEGRALLSNIIYRITDNKTGNYIVFKTFTGHAKDQGEAQLYDKNHNFLNKTYKVIYNQSAQWTIIGIPAGTYTVEEVADGLTLAYDYASNTSSPIESTDLSRVTKYDVTVDEEEVGLDTYGVGGENYRVVFSKNLGGEDHHTDLPPSNVLVGSADIANVSHTETVQVCNYYSKPIGPIKVFKKFAGSEMTDSMQFTFKIEGVGYSAVDSAGNPVSLKAQPLPIMSKKVNDNPNDHTYTTWTQDTVTLTLADMTKQQDGSYTAEALFASIPFRFEGYYYYKIYEQDTGIPGIAYDEAVYYVKIHVTKKYTTFSKTYKAENMTHPNLYRAEKEANKSVTLPDEDFYYLGAVVTYCSDANYSDEIAVCDLSLGKGVNTADPKTNKFIATFTKGKVEDVAFINTRSGNLTVEKAWLTFDGTDDSANQSSLNLSIWQRVEGTSTWTKYGNDIVLQANKNNPELNWKYTVTDLPLMNKEGKRYEYCIKEADSFLNTNAVTYEYTDTDGNKTKVVANDQVKISVDAVTVFDTGYAMHVGSDEVSYGHVKVTNTKVVVNTLPAAGGMGALPFSVTGAVMSVIALIGMSIYRRKRERE